MLVSSLMADVRRRYRNETISDPDLQAFIAAGVRWYSRFNPREIAYDFVTVADQATYTMPSDCLFVTWCYWPRTGVDDLMTIALTLGETVLMGEQTEKHQPSLDVVNDINDAAFLQKFQGSWEYLSGDRTLRLDPTPGTAGITIYTHYAAAHALNTGQTAYETIPDADFDLLVSCALAEVYEARMGEAALEPDYSMGLSR